MDPLAVAKEVAADLRRRGATGVALVGSHARGEAHVHSDLDVVALGRGEGGLRLVGGVLVSESWLPVEDLDGIWSDVALVGQNVPGWRSARPLADPDGDIAALKQRAEAWTWDQLGDAPDRWVAAEVPAYAEEIFRLIGHLTAGRALAAGVMRNVCANRMAWTLGVHHRLLYETENRLWDLVAERMGAGWLERQRAAFGIGVGFADSCWAAADLFAMTGREVDALLSADGRAVVDAAVRAARVARPTSPDEAGSGRDDDR